MTFQPNLFQEPRPALSYNPERLYDYEKEAEVFRQFGGPFAHDQLGIVMLDFGDGLTRKFRFIYNPNNYSVKRWSGPRVEIFGVFGYQDLRKEMKPVDGRPFDTWIRETIEAVKERTVIRFAPRDYAVLSQSAQRLGIPAKKLSKIAGSDDAAKMAVREEDKTPVEIAEIFYERTEYRSHYEIQDRNIYFGRFPDDTQNWEQKV